MTSSQLFDGVDIYFILVAAVSGLFLAICRWFLSPYMQYKNRSKVCDYELTEDGKKIISKQLIGTPFLLRESEKSNVGLSLVVPAYNE